MSRCPQLVKCLHNREELKTVNSHMKIGLLDTYYAGSIIIILYRFEAGLDLLAVELFLCEQEEVVGLGSSPGIVQEGSLRSTGVVLRQQALQC